MRKIVAWACVGAVFIACGGLEASDITASEVGTTPGGGDDDSDAGVTPIGDDDGDDVGIGDDDVPPPTGDDDDDDDVAPIKDAGPEVKTCAPNTRDACPDGQFCKVAKCGDKAGSCAPIGNSNAYAPVCGCDDVNYWNDTVAARRGVSTAKNGECGIFVDNCNQCKGDVRNGSKCRVERASNLGTCGFAPNTKNSCWFLPDTCPANGMLTNKCKGGPGGVEKCQPLCQSIENEDVIDTSVACVP